jgi:hypothetical protein
VFSKRAAGGACVLAGDDLQLPPIHQADPPADLEHVVGSIYSYAQRHLGVVPTPLNVSFRSNSTLIAFTREAGYDPRLRAHSAELKMHARDLPTSAPDNWPGDLTWTDAYRDILSADYPASCIVYEDRQSAQSNTFEAEVIASLTWLLRYNLYAKPLNERDVQGAIIQDERYTAPRLYAAEEFWENGLGIVVPHRAQMSLVAGKLQQLFPTDPADSVRAAVDTVERFQGQQRDVILASFGLGDPDVIAAEEEFLYSLRRFNVMASRARTKLVVIVTRSLIEHLSDDTGVLAESLLLKRFAEQFCQPFGTITLFNQGVPRTCDLRRR